MSAIEALPAPSTLPAAHWSEPCVKAYVRALTRYTVACLGGGHTDVFAMQTLERLLQIRAGIR